LGGIVISSAPPSIADEPAGDSHYTPAEIGVMLGTLTDSDKQRLLASSRYLARDRYIFAADLRQEAFVRALEGRRKCQRSWNVTDFLVGIMRSLTSAEREADIAGHRPVLIGTFGEGGTDPASPAPSPEQVGHDAIHYRRTIAAIREAIDRDPRLTALVDALLDGAKGAELQRRLDIDATELASRRRQLKRVLNNATANRSVP
jgi:DNA-directed RNA polymerase specialized sigma24 family protein